MEPSALIALRHELEADRPRHARALLSPEARALAIERGILGLYRWYTEHSQRSRNWHADTCVDWRTVRRDHSDAISTIVEGFFAVEQYTPDYVGPLLGLIRESYGRSQWHVRWGAEEVRHSDLWANCVTAFGRRSAAWMEDYAGALRKNEFRLPWDSPRHIVFYQVIQERATQVSYMNLALAASGRLPRLQTPVDETLVAACRLIAVDEAAHYSFFVESRGCLYYEPEASVEAPVDVLRHFGTLARHHPRLRRVRAASCTKPGVFGRAIHYRDVVRVVLDKLSAPALRELEAGVRRSREIPATDGTRRTAAVLDTLNHEQLRMKASRLFSRNAAHLARVGLEQSAHAPFEAAWTFEQEPAA
jgi:acyl-[acyl-carrier-protein] desaturase